MTVDLLYDHQSSPASAHMAWIFPSCFWLSYERTLPPVLSLLLLVKCQSLSRAFHVALASSTLRHSDLPLAGSQKLSILVNTALTKRACAVLVHIPKWFAIPLGHSIWTICSTGRLPEGYNASFLSLQMVLHALRQNVLGCFSHLHRTGLRSTGVDSEGISDPSRCWRCR